MTGTAVTDGEEIPQDYGMDVVIIPLKRGDDQEISRERLPTEKGKSITL